jgi:3-hydroxybutyryl-CoA dehydratase
MSISGRAIQDPCVGETAEITREVTAEEIAAFVALVGDHNPVHSDPAAAGLTPFREPIAPGMWTASLLSAVIGSHLPGPGTIYVSQHLRFRRPVRVGDRITARVEVAEILPRRHRVRLVTTCTNQHGEVVVSGEAWVLPPQREDRRPRSGAEESPAPVPPGAPVAQGCTAAEAALARLAVVPFAAWAAGLAWTRCLARGVEAATDALACGQGDLRRLWAFWAGGHPDGRARGASSTPAT